MCASLVSGQTSWLRGHITATKVGDSVAGNDTFKVSGSFTLATGTFSVDPITNGARLQLRNGSGAVKLDVTLPAGAYVAPGPGWKAQSGGKHFVFHDARPGGTQGVSLAVISDRGAGMVEVSVSGKRTTLPFGPGDVPLAATLVLGGPAAGATGECGELRFSAAACRVKKGTSINCR